MASTFPKLLSTRVAVASFDNLLPSRYEFLSLDQAEPNLGTGNVGSILTLGVGNTRVWTSSIVLDGANLSGGNLTEVNTITGALGTESITLEPVGNGLVVINTTTGLVVPTGTTEQRPDPATPGTLRYNTDSSSLEIYDGADWGLVTQEVTNQVIIPDGANTAYSLDKLATSASVLVSINGIVQIPGMSYSYTVTGNVIMFNDVPAVTDIIDIRFL